MSDRPSADSDVPECNAGCTGSMHYNRLRADPTHGGGWPDPRADNADECDRCEGTGDRYGRKPYAGGPTAPCIACKGTGTVIASEGSTS